MAPLYCCAAIGVYRCGGSGDGGRRANQIGCDVTSKICYRCNPISNRFYWESCISYDYRERANRACIVTVVHARNVAHTVHTHWIWNWCAVNARISAVARIASTLLKITRNSQQNCTRTKPVAGGQRQAKSVRRTKKRRQKCFITLSIVQILFGRSVQLRSVDISQFVSEINPFRSA